MGFDGLVKIVSREEWNAESAKGSMPDLPTPQSMQYSVWTKTYWCRESEDCKIIVKQIQEDHMKQGLPDIQYNFLVGADGKVYEGVGWNKNVVDVARKEFSIRPKIIIAMIGVPDEARYTRRMYRTLDRFIQYSYENKFLKLGDKFAYNVDKSNVSAGYREDVY